MNLKVTKATSILLLMLIIGMSFGNNLLTANQMNIKTEEILSNSFNETLIFHPPWDIAWFRYEVDEEGFAIASLGNTGNTPSYGYAGKGGPENDFFSIRIDIFTYRRHAEIYERQSKL